MILWLGSCSHCLTTRGVSTETKKWKTLLFRDKIYNWFSSYCAGDGESVSPLWSAKELFFCRRFVRLSKYLLLHPSYYETFPINKSYTQDCFLQVIREQGIQICIFNSCLLKLPTFTPHSLFITYYFILVELEHGKFRYAEPRFRPHFFLRPANASRATIEIARDEDRGYTVNEKMTWWFTPGSQASNKTVSSLSITNF